MENVNMNSTKSLLGNRFAPKQLSADLNEVKTAVTADRVKAVDRALVQAADLLPEERMRGWYAQQAYRIGVDRFLGLASDARRGRTPEKLFTYLLKRA